MNIENPDTEKMIRFRKGSAPIAHYYGDVVRGCYVVGGFVLLVAVLVDTQLLTFYLSIGVVSILAMVILAGLTSPKTFTILVVEAVGAGIAFLFFEYYAIAAFQNTGSFEDLVFLVRQFLAAIFLLALYYSVKSVRGIWLRRESLDTLD